MSVQVRDGLVTVENGSSTVIGEDTTWLADVEPGNLFIVVGDVVSYEVADIISDTELTLTAPYGGETEEFLNYAIHKARTPRRNYPYPERGDVETATIVKRALHKIDSDLDLLTLAGVGVYSDTTEGINETQNGEVFWVPESDDFVLYLNDSGSASELDRIPNRASLNDALTALNDAIDMLNDRVPDPTGEPAGRAVVTDGEDGYELRESYTGWGLYSERRLQIGPYTNGEVVRPFSALPTDQFCGVVCRIESDGVIDQIQVIRHLPVGGEGATYWVALYQLPHKGLTCEKIIEIEVPMDADRADFLVQAPVAPPGVIWAAKLGSNSDTTAAYGAYNFGHPIPTGYWGGMQAQGAGRTSSFGVFRSDIVTLDGPFPEQLSFNNRGLTADSPPLFSARFE